MMKLNVDMAIPLKEAVTSIDAFDIDGDGADEIILTTIGGDIRVLAQDDNSETGVREITRLEGLPPVALAGRGCVLEAGKTDFILAGLDNSLYVISYREGRLSPEGAFPLGILPTALCVTNVMGDGRDEVIVATNDKALRCYGWYDEGLDKLAHKVVDYPVFSIYPFKSKSVPYSRFVLGDESKNLYVYQYADDRLHEASKISTKGAITLVTCGIVTAGRVDEVLGISDGVYMTLYNSDQGSLHVIDNLRAPGRITSARIGRVTDKSQSPGQIVLSQGNSNIGVISLDGKRLNPTANLRTCNKTAESHIALGCPQGDNLDRILQAVGPTIYVVSVTI